MPLALAADVADARARAAERGTRCFLCCSWARASEVTFAYLSPRIAGRRDAPGVRARDLVFLSGSGRSPGRVRFRPVVPRAAAIGLRGDVGAGWGPLVRLHQP